MLIQKIILKSEVVDNFEDFINEYCEQYHIINKTPKSLICKIMVEEFHGLTGHGDDWVRKKIDTRFKPPYRVRNGKLRSKKNVESKLADIAKQTIDYMKKR